MGRAPRENVGRPLYQKAGTEFFSMKVPLTYGEPMEAVRSGYARCSTDRQDLTARRSALARLGVNPERIYTDHGLSGCTPTSSARPDSAVPRGPSEGAPGESDRVSRFPFDCDRPRFMRELACRVRQDLVALPACLEKGCMRFRDRLQFMDG